LYFSLRKEKVFCLVGLLYLAIFVLYENLAVATERRDCFNEIAGRRRNLSTSNAWLIKGQLQALPVALDFYF